MGGFYTTYGPDKSLTTTTPAPGVAVGGGASGPDLTAYLQQALGMRMNDRQMAMNERIQDRALALEDRDRAQRQAAEDRAYMMQQRGRGMSPSPFGGGGGGAPSFGGGGGGGGGPMMRGADSGRAGSDSGRLGGGNSQDQYMKMLRERDDIMQMQARQNGAPMRMVTGAGITPGYVMDTNAMNAYQRQAYLPSGSAMIAPGAAGLDDGRDFENFQRSSGANDRGAAQNTNLGGKSQQQEAPAQNNAFGPGQILTPANAAVPGRQLSQEELLRQRQANARYGR